MCHFSSSLPVLFCLFICLAPTWTELFFTVLLSNSPWKQERRDRREESSASPEQRQATSRYPWYGTVSSTNVARVMTRGDKLSSYKSLCESCFCFLIFCSTCKCSISAQTVYISDSDSKAESSFTLHSDSLHQVADSMDSKPLLLSTGGRVLKREKMHEAGPSKQQTAFCPLLSKQAFAGLC